jgi:NAD(P)H-hydrate epimerase
LANAADLEPLLEKADVLAFGPGLGRSAWAQEMYERISTATQPITVTQPMVWDADALNLLAANPKSVGHRVITPHPGEAATLLGATTRTVQADRPAALVRLAEKYGGTVVLKGAGTLVSSSASPATRVWRHPVWVMCLPE